MKAICVDIDGLQSNDLILGKVYNIELDKYFDRYFVNHNDSGCPSTFALRSGHEQYYKHRFRLLEDIREEKLNELGI